MPSFRFISCDNAKRTLRGEGNCNDMAKYDYWLTSDGLLLLTGWARDGLTDEQIAGNMGISPSTLYEWKSKYPEISEALKKGKEVVDYQVENALLKKALEGDTTAIIFWLKNRKCADWRDKPKEVLVMQEKSEAAQLTMDERKALLKEMFDAMKAGESG